MYIKLLQPVHTLFFYYYHDIKLVPIQKLKYRVNIFYMEKNNNKNINFGQTILTAHVTR